MPLCDNKIKEKFDFKLAKIEKLSTEFGGKSTNDPIKITRFTHFDGDSGTNRCKKKGEMAKNRKNSVKIEELA